MGIQLKSNGTRKGRFNAREYEQVDRLHYTSDSRLIFRASDQPHHGMTCFHAMVHESQMNMSYYQWWRDLLQGRFENNEELYIEIPVGFEKYCSGDTVLQMNVHVYGTKQVAYYFFKTFVKHVKRWGTTIMSRSISLFCKVLKCAGHASRIGQ